MDYYKILGLQRSATKKAVKEAYRRLAMKHHPHKHFQVSKAVRDGATRRFMQFYEVLIHDCKRAAYNIRSSYQNRHGGGGGYHHRSHRAHHERYRNYRHSAAGGGFGAEVEQAPPMWFMMILLNFALGAG